MLNLAISYASLAEAAILFVASSFTLKKLYQGSKSNFAYLLTAFAFSYGICRLELFFVYIFPNKTVNEPNVYA